MSDRGKSYVLVCLLLSFSFCKFIYGKETTTCDGADGGGDNGEDKAILEE